MQVSVMGLGALGQPIAANLLKAGFDTVVWNRTPQAAEPLVKLGARQAANPAEAFRSDIVLSLLFDDDAVEEIFLDSDLLAKARPGTLHACMSTISTPLVARLMEAHAAHGVGYIGAPVLGRPDAAAAAMLNILPAGTPDQLARLAPVFAALGRTWPMGEDPRHGHIAKIAANFLLFSAGEAMLEAAQLIRSHGGDAAPLLTMMSETLLASPIYKLLAPAMSSGEFIRSAETSRIPLKDLGLAIAEGANTSTRLPFAEIVLDRFEKATR
jgi:3-hydroxyisobutyrate dehydrogenase-like beta-hydroxyacid dehydrogenase